MNPLQKIVEISKGLSYQEMDSLKFSLSLLATEKLENTFCLPKDAGRRDEFFSVIDAILSIEPEKEAIPEYGIAFCGRPGFVTDELLASLLNESEKYFELAKPRTGHYSSQFIYQPETEDSVALAFAKSDDLLTFVESCVGKVVRSHVTSYIYYRKPGQASYPHIDNAFTSITVMLNIRNDSGIGGANSRCVAYWPQRDTLEYQLMPGDVSVFFGSRALHGRTPVIENESVTSLLFSFIPYSLKDKILL